MGRKLTDGLTLKPNGTYELIRRIDGKRKSFSSKNPREVWEKYNAYLRSNDAERDEIKRGKMFSDVAQEWWANKESEIAYGSRRTYKSAMKRAVDALGQCRITSITPEQCNSFIQGLNFARKTVSNQLSVLNMIFRYSIVRGYAKSNPCQYVEIPSHLAHSTRHLLTPEQLQAVKVSAGTPDSLLAQLILYTGTRCGEALALQWKDVDFENNRIGITKAVVHHGNCPEIEKTKTQAGIRVVPLLTPLRALLLPLVGNPDDYIIGGKNPLSKSALNRYWERYIKQLNVGQIDRHQIRHEYATMLYEAGVDVLTAKTIMGHTDIATTQRIYTHIRECRIDDARKKLEAMSDRWQTTEDKYAASNF